MLPCVLVPDLAGFDWPASACFPETCQQTEHDDDFLKRPCRRLLLELEECVEQGVYPALRWSRFHGGGGAAQRPLWIPIALTGRRGAQEEFTGTLVTRINSRRRPRQKVCWRSPLYVFGAVERERNPCCWFVLTVRVTTMTEPRGVAGKEEGAPLLEVKPYEKPQFVSPGIPRITP